MPIDFLFDENPDVASAGSGPGAGGFLPPMTQRYNSFIFCLVLFVFYELISPSNKS